MFYLSTASQEKRISEPLSFRLLVGKSLFNSYEPHNFMGFPHISTLKKVAADPSTLFI